MSQKDKYDWFAHGLLIGAGVGLLGGIFAGTWYHKNKKVNADLVLESVKQAFLKEGTIEGSWIQCVKKPLQKFAIQTDTYTGGISRLEDGQIVQYEFIADAHTGSVLDIYRL